MTKYFVIVPAYNEERNIRRCINNIYKYCKNIIVVDDGSSDKTGEVLDSIPNIQVIHLPSNGGKGRAMKVGAEAAWGMGAKAIIYMDGDNQHDPKHIAEFTKLLDKKVRIIVGVRILKTNIPFYRKLGNVIMAYAMQKLFSVRIMDMMCGYRAFSKQGYRDVRWESNGYEVETEVVAKIGAKNLKYKTVVVDTIYHDKYKGFSILDGFKILAKIPGWKLRNI